MEYNTTDIEEKVHTMLAEVRAAPAREKKSALFYEIGDLRLEAYRQTGDSRQRKLAKNLYFAAKLYLNPLPQRKKE